MTVRSVFSGYFVHPKSQWDFEFKSMFEDRSYGKEITMFL